MSTRRAVPVAPRSWVQPIYRSFDGIRAIAMLAVFFIHYGGLAISWKGHYPPLWTGVDLFFVLSGFLITGILLDNLEDRHFFRNFYGRRALRIFPLFYGIFLCLLLLWPLFHLTGSPYVLTSFLYVGNWFIKSFWLHGNGNPTVIWVPLLHGNVMLSHFWTLCVEEQYYVAWPMVVFVVRKRRWLLTLCGAGALTVLCCRTFCYLHCSPEELATRFLYYSTWSRCDALLIGSGVAIGLREVQLSRETLRRIAGWLIWGSLASILLGYALFGWRFPSDEINPVLITYGYTAVAVCAVGFLLLAIDDESRTARVLRTPWLASLGKISYGMYVLHLLPLDPVEQFTQNHLRPHHLHWLAPFVMFAGTWAAATLSFRYVEQPFLRLKRYFQPVVAPGGPAPRPGSAPLPTQRIAA